MQSQLSDFDNPLINIYISGLTLSFQELGLIEKDQAFRLGHIGRNEHGSWYIILHKEGDALPQEVFEELNNVVWINHYDPSSVALKILNFCFLMKSFADLLNTGINIEGLTPKIISIRQIVNQMKVSYII